MYKSKQYLGYLSRFTVLLFFLSLNGGALKAQSDTSNSIKYTPDFEFREGVFLNHAQVRNNRPIPKSRILTSVDYDDRDFFVQVLDKKTFFYYDNLGMKQELSTDNVWGFSRNGILFVAIDDKFHRITIIGSICHFVATITTYDTRYYDPYYYNPYDYYYDRGGYPNNTQSSEMRQYIMDFEAGKVYDYDFKSLEILLMKDPELHDEYVELSKKKKRQQKFVYLRRFNQRNPLYFPKN